MNTVQEHWQSFMTQVIPKDAPPVQINEMRIAFYAGATAMCGIHNNIIDMDISNEAVIRIMKGCEDEVMRFIQKVTDEDAGGEHEKVYHS